MTAAKHKILPPSAQESAVVTKAVIRAAAILDIKNVVLSKVVGLSEAQVSRIYRGQAMLEGKPFELGLLFVRFFRGLQGIVGNDDVTAKSWLRSNNLALNAIPLDLIQTVMGLTEVVQYVDSRRARI